MATTKVTLRIPESLGGLGTHGDVHKFDGPRVHSNVELVAGGEGERRPYAPGIYSYRFFVTGFGAGASFSVMAIDEAGGVIRQDSYTAPPGQGKTFRFEVS